MPIARTLTLLMVRHGETAWNAEGRWQGQTDVPLSDRGREQARFLGARLRCQLAAKSLPAPARVLSSDLSRASETARLVSEEAGLALEPTHSSALRERGFGEWEGLTFSEVTERWGEDAERPESAEPYPAVWARMLGELESLWERGETALVVGHGGSLRCWLAHCAGLGDTDLRRFALGNTSLSIAVWTGSSLATASGRLLRVNDTAHLETCL